MLIKKSIMKVNESVFGSYYLLFFLFRPPLNFFKELRYSFYPPYFLYFCRKAWRWRSVRYNIQTLSDEIRFQNPKHFFFSMGKTSNFFLVICWKTISEKIRIKTGVKTRFVLLNNCLKSLSNPGHIRETTAVFCVLGYQFWTILCSVRTVVGLFKGWFPVRTRTGVPWIIIDYNGKMLSKILSL